MGVYALRKSGTTQFHWTLIAANREKILSSELYNSKAGALNGIESCKLNSPVDERYNRLNSRDGLFYFVLKAANGEPIGTSETYSSAQARETGIASVKDNGPTSPTEDFTG